MKLQDVKEVPVFTWSEITCGETCWNAKHEDCHCSCGGANHGIWLKGGKPVYRTCKHNGVMYRLLAAGKFEKLREIQIEELKKYGLMRCYTYANKYFHQTYADYYCKRGDKDTPNFPLVCKFATLAQCDKWHELGEFKGIDKQQRYFLAPALLWEVIEPPSPFNHICGQ